MIGIKARGKIEDKLDELIEKAHKFIDETKIWNSDLDKTQFRNLLDLASSVESFKVIENFIFYQMGRDTKSKSWSSISNRKAFGELLIEELKSLEKVAEEIANQTKEEVKTIYIELVKLYIGYANRYFTFKKEEKKKAEGGRE
jgi:hypothetical protein